jgi:hypothetical protein
MGLLAKEMDIVIPSGSSLGLVAIALIGVAVLFAVLFLRKRHKP